MVVIAPSGSGKTPACHLGCIDPIVECVMIRLILFVIIFERKKDNYFLMR